MRYHKLLGIGLITYLSACSGQTNLPPKLGTLTPYRGEKIDNASQLEYRVEIPSMLELLDVNADQVYDIKGVKAYLKKLGDSNEKEFFKAEWDDKDKVNIQNQAFRIPIEKPDFETGSSYEVTISVWDKQQRKDNLTVLLHIDKPL